MGVPADKQRKPFLMVQDFLSELWKLIHEVCQSYRDEEWVADYLEADDCEFYVDWDGEVVGDSESTYDEWDEGVE